MYSKTLLIRIFSKIDKYGSTSRVHKNFFINGQGLLKRQVTCVPTKMRQLNRQLRVREVAAVRMSVDRYVSLHFFLILFRSNSVL